MHWIKEKEGHPCPWPSASRFESAEERKTKYFFFFKRNAAGFFVRRYYQRKNTPAALTSPKNAQFQKNFLGAFRYASTENDRESLGKNRRK